MANKFSSCLGEQVKCKGASSRIGPVVHAEAGYNPASRGLLCLDPVHEGNRHQGMKFSEKYELLETLTTGGVETFVANDRVRGERVLVHIVECVPQKGDQTTTEWALESFRKLAPDPPGPVLETGKYSGAKYAYVVTKPVDETLVKAWVRRYELHEEDTRETKAHGLKTELSAPTAAPPRVAPPLTPKEPEQAPGQMTQLFRDFDSLAKSKAPEPAAIKPNVPPVRPAPSTSLPGESGLHAAVPWDPFNAKAAAPPKEPPIATPPARTKPVAPELPPVARDSAKPGEFTSFFQGPFRGDGPSDMPALSSQPIEPPKKNVGEFTAMFGGATPPHSATPAKPSASGSTFTSMFEDMETPPPTFNVPAPIQAGVIPAPAQSLPAVPPMNATPLPDPVFAAAPPVPVVIPNPPAPAIPPTPSVSAEKPVSYRPSSLPGDGATGAFMRHTSDPMPVPVEAPSGPSPYTQIISRSKLAAAEDADAGQAPAAEAGSGKFAAPSIPKIPAAAPPPMPKIPPPPRIAAPPMPKVKAPPAPKVPKFDAPAPPPVSIWPLIITLTVLFFLAVILVLFFALRH